MSGSRLRTRAFERAAQRAALIALYGLPVRTAQRLSRSTSSGGSGRERRVSRSISTKVARQVGRGAGGLQAFLRVPDDGDTASLEIGRVDRVIDVPLPVEVAVADDVRHAAREVIEARRGCARRFRRRWQGCLPVLP